MADVFEAYKFLSKSTRSNFSVAVTRGSEADFKMAWMRKNGYPESEVANYENWEFFLHLQPKAQPASATRSTASKSPAKKAASKKAASKKASAKAARKR